MSTQLGLSIMVEQIANAEHLTCDYCDRIARALVRTGADPEKTPCCGDHAAQMLETNASTFRFIEEHL